MDLLSLNRAKKWSLYSALLLAALCVILAPHIVRASFFDFAKGLFPQAAAQNTSVFTYTSQNMPLLSPAKNIDPKPSQGGGDIAIVGGALIAQDGPSGTLSDIEARPESTQISVHVVREGDTLSQIAELYNVRVNTIIWANDIKGRYIQPGQELVILPITGVRHTVAKGETLASIVKKYQGDLAETASYNEIGQDAALAAGMIIIIPDGVVAPPPASRITTAARAAVSTVAAASGYYGWPVNGGVVSQGLHGYNGIDIAAPLGTTIFAAAAGEVIVARAGGYNGGYGSYVVLQHANGTQTLYGHMSSVAVSAGMSVAKGQTIGGIGSTGKSTGNHLHFEVRGASNPFR